MGQSTAEEVLIYGNVAASIQPRTAPVNRTGSDPLPYDAGGPVAWRVFIPAATAPIGGIKTRDIVVDDAGDIYQINSAYPNVLNWQLDCTRLEA